MKPNFDNYSDIKSLGFFTKEICPYYIRFLHTKKDSGGASFHRIDESFRLRPSLLCTIFMDTPLGTLPLSLDCTCSACNVLILLTTL